MTLKKQLLSPTLTEEKCNAFRRLPVSFNEMVQAIYDAGIAHGRADALKQSKDATSAQASLDAIEALEALHKDIDGYDWKSALDRLASVRQKVEGQSISPVLRHRLDDDPAPF